MRYAILLAGLLAACNHQTNNVPIAPVLADSADMIYYKMDTQITKAGVLVSTVRADSAWYYERNANVEMKMMAVVFTDSIGNVRSTITSKRGTYETTTNQRLEAFDSVVAVTPRGDTLRTPHLVWDKALDKITSDTTFTFTSPDKANPGSFSRLGGKSFESTPDFKTVRVSKAKGEQVEGGKPAPKKTPVVKKDSAVKKDSGI